MAALTNISYGIIDITFPLATEEDVLERGCETGFNSVGEAFKHLSGQNNYLADFEPDEYVPYTVGSCKKMIIPIVDGEIFTDIVFEVAKSYAATGDWMEMCHNRLSDDDDMSFDISDAEVDYGENEEDLLTAAEEFCIAAPDFCIAAPGEL